MLGAALFMPKTRLLVFPGNTLFDDECRRTDRLLDALAKERNQIRNRSVIVNYFKMWCRNNPEPTSAQCAFKLALQALARMVRQLSSRLAKQLTQRSQRASFYIDLRLKGGGDKFEQERNEVKRRLIPAGSEDFRHIRL
jgi:hypothetical protein